MGGGIEFLPEEFSDKPAEAAPARPRRRAPSWRWLAVAVVVLAFAGWVITRSFGTTRSTASRLSDRVATSAPYASAAPAVVAAPDELSTRTVMCPTGVPVQTDIRRAMHRYLPGVVITYPTSYRCSRGLGTYQAIVFESVQGRYRGLVITVALTTPLQAGLPVLASSAPDPGLVVLGSVHVQTPGHKVEILAMGHRGETAPDAQMLELAGYLVTTIRL